MLGAGVCAGVGVGGVGVGVVTKDRQATKVATKDMTKITNKSFLIRHHCL